MASTGGILGDVGGAVSDLFGGFGDLSEAQGYEQAESIEKSNAQLAGASERLQLYQSNRQVELAQGQAQSAAAGGGLAESGSVQNVLRMGAQQGALQKQIVSTQGQIQVNNFNEQAAADAALAAKAQTAAAGSFLGGALDVAKMFF